MSTPPPHRDFGPNYDRPNRKFHFWAVILPTVIAAALIVAILRDTASGGAGQADIVPCPPQLCMPVSTVADPSKSLKPRENTTSPFASLSSANAANPVSNSQTGQPVRPSPSSNPSPVLTNPAPSTAPALSPSPPAASALIAIRVTLGRSSSVTVLSDA